MTVITYGSSVKETARTRRHARRRAAAIERDSICSIIDAAFGIETEAVAVEVRPTTRVSRAINTPSLREKIKTEGTYCLAETALYNAGHRKVAGAVTAR